MGVFDRLFGRRVLSAARKAELQGDLLRAVELFAEAELPAEVARIMLLRGDAEPDPSKRLQHYTQASENAPAGSPFRAQARVKRAALTIALARDAAVSAATREDLVRAARELEELGEAERAAEAYALVRDTEGEARALAKAGQVERLETLLDAEQSKTSGERQRSQAHAEIETLTLTGRRREALAAAERILLGNPQDASARDRIQALTARRLRGGALRVLLQGRPVQLVVDRELVVGRSEGSIVVASAALSRKHLSIARDGDAIVVRDLGSRNGTQLRGVALAGPIPVRDGLSLVLGGEVKLDVAASKTLRGAVDVDVAGERYVASLGPGNLGIGAWRLERADDDWVELASDDDPPAFQGELAVAPRTTLLVGDRFSASRGGTSALEVMSR